MATYGRPGVYINERLLPAPIAVLGTADAAGACIGKFAQGPETVTRITSWYDFVKTFGGYSSSYPATFGVGAFFQNGGSELYVRRVLPSTADAAAGTIVDAVANSNPATLATVTAKSKGAEGNLLRFEITRSSLTVNDTEVDADYTTGAYNLVIYKEGGATSDNEAGNDLIVEQFSNVVFNDPLSSDYIETVVNLYSQTVTVTVATPQTPINWAQVSPVIGSRVALVGGSDGDADPAYSDYVAALDDFTVVERPLVMFVPAIHDEIPQTSGSGATGPAQLYDQLISLSQSNNWFTVLETAPAVNAAGAPLTNVNTALTWASARQASSYAAVYYPHFYISDPVGRSPQSLRKVGPSGAIAGLYLTTDKQFGPFKSPAGLRASVRGAVALERNFTSSDLDQLNSGTQDNGTVGASVNAIRSVPGAGIVSMGARTLLQDGTANKYVNMRRSLMYIRKSLKDLTEFALFENNDERLWARLRTTISVFLTDYWNQGGIRGVTASQAFFVKVDAENNPENLIAQGEVHIEVGVALQYPAEFVVINLSQKTAA